MKEFIELRRKAKENRDKAIDLARKDYEETLTRIAALEQDLLGKHISSHKFMSVTVARMIPADRPFTVVDILTELEAAHPGRSWRKRSLENQIHRLCKKGICRRVKGHRRGQPALYARLGVAVAPTPFMGQKLKDIIPVVLKGKSLTQTELAVLLLEAGYETSMHSKAFRNTVGTIMRADARYAVAKDGKWSLA